MEGGEKGRRKESRMRKRRGNAIMHNKNILVETTGPPAHLPPPRLVVFMSVMHALLAGPKQPPTGRISFAS